MFLEKDKLAKITLHQYIWLLGLVISVAFILGNIKYFNLATRPPIEKLGAKYYLYMHIISGTTWFISGFLQFTNFFQSNKTYHRRNGYIYYISALLSTLSLVMINLTLQRQSLFRTGPLQVSIYTIVCLILSFYYIRKKNVPLHRAWVMRSFITAIEIPFNRLVIMLAYLFKYPIRFNTHLVLLVVIELVILKKLNFTIIDNSKSSSIVLKIFYSLLALLLFCLVFYWQMFLENKRPG